MAAIAIPIELLTTAEKILNGDSLSDDVIQKFQKDTQGLGFDIDVDKDGKVIIGPQTKRTAMGLVLQDEFGVNALGLRTDLLEAMVNDKKINEYARDHIEALADHNSNPGATQIDIAISSNQVFKESTFNPTAANIFENDPKKNSYGMYQFTLETAKEKEYGLNSVAELNDPVQARQAYIKFSVKALEANNNDPILKLVRYNAGQGAINDVKDELGKDNITGLEWVKFMKERSEWRNNELNKGIDPKDWPEVRGSDRKMYDQHNLWDQRTLKYIEKIIPDLDQRLQTAGLMEKPEEAANQTNPSSDAEDTVRTTLETVFAPLGGSGTAYGADKPPTGEFTTKNLEQETETLKGVEPMAEEEKPTATKPKKEEIFQPFSGTWKWLREFAGPVFVEPKAVEPKTEIVKNDAEKTNTKFKLFVNEDSALRVKGSLNNADPNEIDRQLAVLFKELPAATDLGKLTKSIESAVGGTPEKQRSDNQNMYATALAMIKPGDTQTEILFAEAEKPKLNFDVFVEDSTLKTRGSLAKATPEEMHQALDEAIQNAPEDTSFVALSQSMESLKGNDLSPKQKLNGLGSTVLLALNKIEGGNFSDFAAAETQEGLLESTVFAQKEENPTDEGSDAAVLVKETTEDLNTPEPTKVAGKDNRGYQNFAGNTPAEILNNFGAGYIKQEFTTATEILTGQQSVADPILYTSTLGGALQHTEPLVATAMPPRVQKDFNKIGSPEVNIDLEPVAAIVQANTQKIEEEIAAETKTGTPPTIDTNEENIILVGTNDEAPVTQYVASLEKKEFALEAETLEEDAQLAKLVSKEKEVLPKPAELIREEAKKITEPQKVVTAKQPETYGIVAFSVGNPLEPKDFSKGAAVSWSKNPDNIVQIKLDIEGMFDSSSDGTYPYEDYYKGVEQSFLTGIGNAKTVDEAAVNWAGLQAVAELSKDYRPDMDSNKELIMASYVDQLKGNPEASTLLAQIGVAVEDKTGLAKTFKDEHDHKQTKVEPEELVLTSTSAAPKIDPGSGIG